MIALLLLLACSANALEVKAPSPNSGTITPSTVSASVGYFSGPVTASSVTVEASGGTSLAVGRTGFSTRATLDSDGNHGYLSTAGGAGALIFRVNNVEKARVHTDGNFGVGTNAPAATIHVDASGGGTIRVTRLGAGSGYIQIDADGTDGTVASTNKLHLNTNGAQRAAIDENGNFGIGSGATKSTFTATGFWEPISKTKAQIDALIPTKVGQVIYASDTTLPGLCVSTGTAAAQWRKMESATLGCGSGN